ncbi:MAG: rod shape-determining protein RodA [Deltaproteobacteria bacterium]|jgi:rod shape determining protein RodA|nr:rod shape-determining protein RodA [Deltaproteobacteria bacterium]
MSGGMDRRLLLHANWPLLGFGSLLFLLGMVNLYSASGERLEEGIRVAPFFYRQILWGGIGLCGLILCTIFDYRHLKPLAFPFFAATILMLILVPLIGVRVSGAQRWISLGFFNLQPSELAKISTLLMTTTLLSRYQNPLDWSRFLLALLISLLPCALIFIQPDLGTALLLPMLTGGVILYHGIRPSIIKGCLFILPVLPPVAWFFLLKEYQKKRILTFLDPSLDPTNAGYHITNSKIAIGSGEIWGKGFQEGSHHLLRFLPEKHTDFALAVFSEEWGLVGSILLLSFFCCFLLCIINTAKDAKDRFGSLLCAGIFFYFFWQILINMGMVLGLIPVVGVPLPFISYGGTATIVNFILLGIVMNVSMRRFMFKIS